MYCRVPYGVWKPSRGRVTVFTSKVLSTVSWAWSPSLMVNITISIRIQ